MPQMVERTTAAAQKATKATKTKGTVAAGLDKLTEAATQAARNVAAKIKKVKQAGYSALRLNHADFVFPGTAAKIDAGQLLDDIWHEVLTKQDSLRFRPIGPSGPAGGLRVDFEHTIIEEFMRAIGYRVRIFETRHGGVTRTHLINTK
jgi:hypothetical protein